MAPRPARRGRGVNSVKCPICGKPAAPDRQPFCSARCADVDLHRWLAGSYVLPGAEDTDELASDDDEDA